jgi:coenzyme F420-reducing hydrogenase alpha subunit
MHGADITELTLDEISKIEGKASLHVRFLPDDIEVQFSIVELKRFYTQALMGKDVAAVPQLTARICGTCSNAHLLCAIKAVEEAYGVHVSDQTKKLRELLNWGLIIRDHALHLMVFVLPDILGVDSILDLDENDPVQHQWLHDTFDVKGVGNHIAKIIAGRSVHAPFLAVGGFLKMPDQTAFPGLIDELRKIRPAVLRMIEIFTNRDMHLSRDITFSALIDDRLTLLDGTVKDTTGKSVDAETYRKRLNRTVITHSHASGYKDDGHVFMVGAIARLNMGKDHLHERTRNDASTALSLFPSNDIFHNNLAQAIEILHAVDSSIDLLTGLTIAIEKPHTITKKAAHATAVIEAPRGTLVYYFDFTDEGKIRDVSIIVPTGQNQIGIEEAIKQYFMEHRTDSRESLTLAAERIIRAYDPCMSCASHFLKVTWDESSTR